METRLSNCLAANYVLMTLHEMRRPLILAMQEFFELGAAMVVQSLWTAKDGKYEVLYKSRWRHDGLVRRAEIGNGKLVEEFEGRADGLVYRSARFSARMHGPAFAPSSVW